MRIVIAALLLTLSLSAVAAMGMLINSQYLSGTTWACTYQVGNLQITRMYNGTCPGYIQL